MRSPAKPLLFLTGFLGAGKTTLLRGLLENLRTRGRSADVILNDFANADLDAATLDGAAASIAPIAASCACCESLDELVALCLAAAKKRGDLLLVELNGTADPLSLLEAFTLLEEKLPFFPRLQVCVVDARHWGRRGEFAMLERRQLETAGLWLPSHIDEVGRERLDQVDSEVRALVPLACRVDAQVLVEALVDEISGAASDSETGAPAGTATPLPIHAGLAKIGLAAFMEDEVHRLSHRFTGCSLALPPRVRRHTIEALLRDLPPWVIRAKALVKLVENPGSRWLFQRSGTDEPDEPIEVSEVRRVSPSLVCVGPRLDPGRLEAMIRAQFGTVPGLSPDAE
ncbi:MAG: GTP-binding protein [Verrucomicrobiales bacterium]